MNNTTVEQPYPVSTADSAVVRLVQFTDCHIYASAETQLWGLNTRQSFSAVSNAAIKNSGKLDLLLATGDLSQDGKAESYVYLAQQFENLGVPTFWLPGNHDDNDVIEEHFRGNGIHASNHILIGSWQIVLLDSTLEGEVHGRLPATQLEFLSQALNTFPDRHALVCLHHQAIACGSEWLDLKGLINSNQLRAQLALHDNVKAVLWGHVHQESARTMDNVLWMSTPSSCVQFKPDSKDFALGSEAPGYRDLSLYANGNIETMVHRVALDEPDSTIE